MQKKTLIITIISILIIITSIIFIIIIYPKLNKKENNPTNDNIENEKENSIQTNNDIEIPALEETPNMIEVEETESPIPNNDEKNSTPKAEKPDVKPTTSSKNSTTNKGDSTNTAKPKVTPTPTTDIEERPTPNVVETPKQDEIKRCTNVNNHGMDVGNSGKWFNTKAEAVAYYDSITAYWGTKWENFEIDDATYDANCPSRI